MTSTSSTTNKANGLTDSIGGNLFANKPAKTSTSDNSATGDTGQQSEPPQPAGQWQLAYNADQPEQMQMYVSIDLKSLGIVQIPLPTDSSCTIGYHDNISLDGVNSMQAWLTQVKGWITEAEKAKK